MDSVFQLMIDNGSKNAIVVLDIQNPDYQYTNVSQYSIKSYIQYCNKYNIDLILQRGICPRYRIEYLEQTLKNYYAKIVPQLFKYQQLFQHYQKIGIRFENDMIITPNAPNYFDKCNSEILSFQLIDDIECQVQFNAIQYYSDNLSKLRNVFGTVYSDMRILFKLNDQYKATSGIKICSREARGIYRLDQFYNFLKSARNFRPNQMYIEDHFVNFKLIKLLQQGKLDYSNFLYINQEVFNKIRIVLNPIKYPNQVLKSYINETVEIIHCGGGGISNLNQKIRMDRLRFFYKGYYE